MNRHLFGAAIALCMPYDEHHGSSGTFVGGADGKRQPVTPDKDGYVTVGDQKLHRPDTKRHSSGVDAPRNEKGERVDHDAAHQAAAAPQSAMPLAASTPPWVTPPAKKAEGAESSNDHGAPKRVRADDKKGE